MQPDDNAAAAGDTADAASAAEAPEPASGWRFVRIHASAADAGASMSARAREDPRLSRKRKASVANAAASGACRPAAGLRSRVDRPPARSLLRRRRAPTPRRSRGRYLALAGDCAACHDAADHTPYAGGQPVNSPFGPIYAPNITPDPTHGIGLHAAPVRRRVAARRARGSRLYPAMPYPSLAHLTDDDVRALYAYFMRGVAPSPNAAKLTQLPFPFNQRWALGLWSLAFANRDRFTPSRRNQRNGIAVRYLVQGLGHCGACHTPRGPAYNERGYDERSPRVPDRRYQRSLVRAEPDRRGLGRPRPLVGPTTSAAFLRSAMRRAARCSARWPRSSAKALHC
ncbi:c-type cytochrome [Burkholderia anthina]|uniref:c-type cytochrome n=1 Tax=Burkholderia anthina TaxID=179879 RepID=UPI0012DACB77|nr:cytochrome c [Burkholderia anthina]